MDFMWLYYDLTDCVRFVDFCDCLHELSMPFLINLGILWFTCLVLMWSLTNFSTMAALGYPYAKSSIIDYLVGCMEL